MANGYLTFNSNSVFVFTIRSSSQYNGSLEYSTDTETWSEVVKATSIRSVWHKGGYKIYFRGTNNTYFNTGSSSDVSPIEYTGTAYIQCEGNIETLLDYQKVLNGEHPSMSSNCFSALFNNFLRLTQAPELPATRLTSDCYRKMFMNCTSLTTAPVLPATTLTYGCYYSMFSGCTSLTTAPELPATTLADYCYNGMFNGCTSLTTAPELPATTLTVSCYGSMFRGCSNLIQAPELPATKLAKWCYLLMFGYCTKLTSLPSLLATTLAESCYSKMFYGCTGIHLSTVQTNKYCIEYQIPYGTATGIMGTDSLMQMFVSTGGTFTGTPTINKTYYLRPGYDLLVNGEPLHTINGYQVKNVIYHGITYKIDESELAEDV